MIQNKRTSNFDVTNNIIVKKSRVMCTKDELLNTKLEHLSNELFYEIFDYLDTCDVYRAFSKLNIRMENLISCSTYRFKINTRSTSHFKLEDQYRKLIVPSRHRILSLHFRHAVDIRHFLKFCSIDSSFTRLESIVINRLELEKLVPVLFYLSSLPCLYSLTINIDDSEYVNHFGDFYRIIFSLRNLKYIKVSLSTLYEGEIPMNIPIAMNEKLTNIKYFNIYHQCTLYQLASLLSCLPNIYRLKCSEVIEAENVTKKYPSLKLSHLKSMSIMSIGIDFNDLECFIKEISSPLEIFRIKECYNIGYLNANKWERLIKRHMPDLKQLYLKITYFSGWCSDKISIQDSIEQFCSSFWLEKKWYNELEIGDDEITFTIYPEKKEWFNINEYMIYGNNSKEKTIENPSNFSNKNVNRYFTVVTLVYYAFMKNDQNVINTWKTSFNAIHLTHLNIVNNNICMNMLIKILQVLPNLDSLNLLPLSTNPSEICSLKEKKDYLLVSFANKITKVKIDKVTDKAQIRLLIGLCRRLQYLNVDCKSNIDLRTLISSILTSQMTAVPHLCFLCVNISNADEIMVESIRRTIEIDTLIDKCQIKRKNNNIFIQW